MQTWLKKNWRIALLHVFAASVMVYVLTQGKSGWIDVRTGFDPMLECGKWAVRFLLFSLAMTPLNALFGWRSAILLRKPAGNWAFRFAAVHLILFFLDRPDPLSWFGGLALGNFITQGLAALVILSLLALTSNQRAQQLLRKNWKRLHRLVYVAGGLVILHATLATTASKKVLVRDPNAIYELRVYLAILVVLLVVRLPPVRNMLRQITTLRFLRRRSA